MDSAPCNTVQSAKKARATSQSLKASAGMLNLKIHDNTIRKRQIEKTKKAFQISWKGCQEKVTRASGPRHNHWVGPWGPHLTAKPWLKLGQETGQGSQANQQIYNRFAEKTSIRKTIMVSIQSTGQPCTNKCLQTAKETYRKVGQISSRIMCETDKAIQKIITLTLTVWLY